MAPRKKVGGRPYKNYAGEKIEQALTEVVHGRLSIRKSAEKYGVPKSTLQRKFRGVHIKSPGRQTAFTAAQEKYILSGILTAARWGFPLTKIDVRRVASSYLERKGMRVPTFKNNVPGKAWIDSFLIRHKHAVSNRLSENIKRSRAAVTKDTLNQYFDKLYASLTNVPESNVLNYDETNFCDDPGNIKVLVRRGAKHSERMLDTSKTSISVMFTVSGDGKLLPPYVVYKSQHLHDTWCQYGPPGTVYNRTKSGWFDSFIFKDWYFKIVLPYFKNLDGPKILLGDNLASHLTLDVIKSCEENDIMFILLPPNSTHLSQPLDVAFFRPLKISWKRRLTEWKKRHRGVVPKDTFPSLLNETLQEMKDTTKTNILAGFRACGIFPQNRQAVLKRIPDGKEASGDEEGDLWSSSFADLLRSTRKANEVQPRRKKKIAVAPGQGITAADLIDRSVPGTSQMIGNFLSALY